MNNVETKTSDRIYFKGVLSEPFDNSTKIIIHIHGNAGNIDGESFYKMMHHYYPMHGISFLVGQNRGSGSITDFKTDSGVVRIGNAYELFEDCVLDIQAWVDFAKTLGYTDIWLQGHSLGAVKTAYYTANNLKESIAGNIWLSPCDMIGLVHDEYGQKFYDEMYPQARKMLNEGREKELLQLKLFDEVTFSAKSFLNFYGDNPATAVFNYSDENLEWDLVNNIKTPVLAITGTQDDGIVPVIDPYKAMKKLEEELIATERVKTIVLEGAEHLFKGYEGKIAKEVITFIKKM